MRKSSKKEKPTKQKRKRLKSGFSFEVGSGNVFADIGLEDPDMLLAKSELVCRLNSIFDARCLTQTQAAQLLGVDQPKVSALRRGRLGEFSMERLMRFLRLLDQQVEISVQPAISGRTLKVVPLEIGTRYMMAACAPASRTTAMLTNVFNQIAGPYSANATIIQPKSDEDIECDFLNATFALVAGEQMGYSYAHEGQPTNAAKGSRPSH